MKNERFPLENVFLHYPPGSYVVFKTSRLKTFIARANPINKRKAKSAVPCALDLLSSPSTNCS
jgi:hypothetical protein